MVIDTSGVNVPSYVRNCSAASNQDLYDEGSFFMIANNVLLDSQTLDSRY